MSRKRKGKQAYSYIFLQLFQRITTRPDQQTDKINLRMLVLRDEHFIRVLGQWRPKKVEK